MIPYDHRSYGRGSLCTRAEIFKSLKNSGDELRKRISESDLLKKGLPAGQPFFAVGYYFPVPLNKDI